MRVANGYEKAQDRGTVGLNPGLNKFNSFSIAIRGTIPNFTEVE